MEEIRYDEIETFGKRFNMASYNVYVFTLKHWCNVLLFAATIFVLCCDVMCCVVLYCIVM